MALSLPLTHSLPKEKQPKEVTAGEQVWNPDEVLKEYKKIETYIW
jgi:hypothetical protein